MFCNQLTIWPFWQEQISIHSSPHIYNTSVCTLGQGPCQQDRAQDTLSLFLGSIVIIAQELS